MELQQAFNCNVQIHTYLSKIKLKSEEMPQQLHNQRQKGQFSHLVTFLNSELLSIVGRHIHVHCIKYIKCPRLFSVLTSSWPDGLSSELNIAFGESQEK